MSRSVALLFPFTEVGEEKMVKRRRKGMKSAATQIKAYINLQ